MHANAVNVEHRIYARYFFIYVYTYIYIYTNVEMIRKKIYQFAEIINITLTYIVCIYYCIEYLYINNFLEKRKKKKMKRTLILRFTLIKLFQLNG